MVRTTALLFAVALLAGGKSDKAEAQPKLKADNRAALKVVEAIDDLCATNAQQKPALKGDELMDALVKAAAVEALKAPKDSQFDAFCTGVGIGLDKTNSLSENLVTKGVFGGIETPAAAKTRQANLRLKTISMDGRTDWPLHFGCSIGLAGRMGAPAAENFGLLKEAKDLTGPSGWSWTDINCNLCGIELAERLRSGKIALEDVATKFEVKKVLASREGLDDSLDQEAFKKKYKQIGSSEVKKQLAAIKTAVKAHFDEEWPAPKKK